jgi:uncharacterized oxidoreductase
MAADVTARPEALRLLAAAIFEAAGSAAGEAQCIAENLVLSNLSGHDSHGVGLIPLYVRSVASGAVRPNGTIRIVADTGPMMTLEAGMAFGQVVGRDAMALAIERARQHGIVALAIRNSHHLGRIGHWAEICAEAGLVSTHYVNTLGIKAHVAPHGGSDARYATNPYCAGLPATDGPPVILDMATSKVALGKVRVAMNKGVQMEPDTIIAPGGGPTTDPTALYSDPIGAILPFGGHKGYGLGVICELLGGALTGGGTYNADTPQTGVIHNNMLSIVFDPARFGGTEWRRDADSFAAWVKASPAAAGTEGVLLAGDPERRTRDARRDGVPIDGTTWAEVAAVATDLGLPDRLLADAIA